MSDDRAGSLHVFFALLSGVLFGLGLAISGMIDPGKVLAFLDVAGAWDPTLATVMGGALAVTVPAFRGVLRRRQPWFAPGFVLPTRTDLEPQLLLGAAVFGIGWGLGGLCPGPAIAALVTGNTFVYVFVAAMLAGFVLHDLVVQRAPPSSTARGGTR
ncbi:MAG TPA: DUF6691 family protein [Burkholderiales bacterium]|nr:DUF6691 family protein [Burkholderiales bacterium]